MVKFTKPGRLIAQTSYLGRFKPLKMFGKSSKKIVKVYRRILDLAHCVGRQIDQWDLRGRLRNRMSDEITVKILEKEEKRFIEKPLIH